MSWNEPGNDKKDPWSGRMRWTRNPVYGQTYPGFESLSLRQYLNFEFAQRDSKLAKAPHHAGLCA